MSFLEITTQRMAFGPAAVGRRDDGKVVLVNGGAPDEQVRVEVLSEKPGHIDARVAEVLKPSPVRCEPPCQASATCGGCDWMHLTLSGQRQAKKDIAQGTAARLHYEGDVPLHAASPDLGYRHRARLQLAVREGHWVGGFFESGTHDVVAVTHCPVCIPQFSELLSLLPSITSDVFQEASLELVAAHDGMLFAAIYFATALGDPTPLVDRLMGSGLIAGLSFAIPGKGWSHRGESHSFQVTHQALGSNIPVFPGAFTQANSAVNVLLIEHVLKRMESVPPPGPLLELYAGHGNFTRPLQQRGYSITAVEIGLKRSVLPHLEGVTWYKGPSLEAVERWVRQGKTAAAILLDPPRSGAKEIMKQLPTITSGPIVYVSCDPATFHRDVAMLREQGFHLTALDAFDMMPHTHHIELVGVLER